MDDITKRVREYLGIESDDKLSFKLAEACNFADNSFSYDQMAKYLLSHKEMFIKAIMQDEETKNELLENGGVVDRTKVDKINEQFLLGVFQNIVDHKYTIETVAVISFVTQFLNVYGYDVSDENAKEFLESGIFSVAKNCHIVGDGDKILEEEEIKSHSELLCRWNSVCGNKILDKVFSLDVLKERIEKLLASKDAAVKTFEPHLRELLKTSEIALKVLNDGFVPDSQTIEDINLLFDRYEMINKTLIINSLGDGEHAIVHFVQTEELCLTMTENGPVNIANSENNREMRFNNSQNNNFIKSYYEYMQKQIEEEFGEPFDIHNEKHYARAVEYINKFNEEFNNNPLGALPMNIYETGKDLCKYIRPTSNRISCSYVSANNIVSHLNRTVGLVLKPKNRNAILTQSRGYTSQKEYYDFRKDQVSFEDMKEVSRDRKSTNEIVLDRTECDVVAILLMANDAQSIKKAERLAQFYGVRITRVIDGAVYQSSSSEKE